MWGNISTEASFQTNFNVGFSNTTSDVLIHLSLWQYWWWFWFAFVWSLYLLILLKVSRFRTLKFKPRIMSSMRPHGKWGDLLICLIPLSWCINILINSNFLLKMVEWQSENSLFTIRIRGKQWYWVYKLDLKDFTDILSINKNIGHNKWFFSNFSSLETMDDYLHSVNLRANSQWLSKYWDAQLSKQAKLHNNFSINTLLDTNLNFKKKNFSELFSSFFLKNFSFEQNQFFKNFNKFNNINLLFFSKKPFYNFINNQFNFKNNSNVVLFSDFDETLRWLKRSSGTVGGVRLVKLPLNNYILDNLSDYSDLFRFRFNDNNFLTHKNVPNTTYFAFKQKRYKFRNKVTASNLKQNLKSKTNPFLSNNKNFNFKKN